MFLIALIISCSLFGQSLEQLDQIIKYNPNTIDARMIRGVILFKNDQFRNAIDDFGTVFDNRPRFDVVAYYNLGLCYQKLDMFDEALEVFNNLLSKQPAYGNMVIDFYKLDEGITLNQKIANVTQLKVNKENLNKKKKPTKKSK